MSGFTNFLLTYKRLFVKLKKSEASLWYAFRTDYIFILSFKSFRIILMIHFIYTGLDF
jgi:hypothetical protein